jgi:hypothetical protein
MTVQHSSLESVQKYKNNRRNSMGSGVDEGMNHERESE